MEFILGKLKVHELAKELGVPSKEILEKAKKLKIEVASHLSNLDDEQAHIHLDVDADISKEELLKIISTNMGL